MSLTIKEKKGIYFLSGNINSETSNHLQKHFEVLLESGKSIIVNINNVTEINIKGVLVLKNLCNRAIKRNNKFSITGSGYKEIYDDFRYNNIAS